MAKGEMLAKQFEAKAQEAIATIEKLSDADWKKVTAAEKWPVGVTAQHIGWGHGVIAGLVQSVASGTHEPTITMDDLHAMNAKQAKEWAGVTKSDVLALHRKNAGEAAAIVRGLDDAALGRSAVLLKGMPAMTAEQVAHGLLLGHIDEHLGSIRATVGA